MDDLLFTRASQPRVRPMRLLPTGVPLAVLCVLLLLSGHGVVAAALVGGIATLVAVLRLLFRGAWTRVNAAGISYSQVGAGRTRRLAWHEVDGIQISEARTQTGTVRTVKVVLHGGKRRTLPILSDTSVRPDPDLDRKVAEIRAMSRYYGSQPPATVLPTVEASWSRRDAKFRGWSWRYMTPVIAFGMLIFGGLDVGPAWSAHLGGGKHGTFTATEVHCGSSCSWNGDFSSTDGTDTRYGVGLSGGNVHQVGDRVPADTSALERDAQPHPPHTLSRRSAPCHIRARTAGSQRGTPASRRNANLYSPQVREAQVKRSLPREGLQSSCS